MKRFVFRRKWFVKWPLMISGILLIMACLAGIVRFIGPLAGVGAAPANKVFNTSGGECDQGLTDPTMWNNAAFYRGNVNKKEVALTFDDGPSANTGSILDILKNRGVHATFFLIGSQVSSDTATLVEREKGEGNQVANHTWTHPDLTTLSPARVQSQLSQTSGVIKQYTGSNPTAFRPPYGSINKGIQQQASQLGMTTVGWTIDTCDWTQTLQGGVTTNDIVSGALDNVENGSIILMHDGGEDRSKTVSALPRIITGLQSGGFKFVTVQQMIADTQQS